MRADRARKICSAAEYEVVRSAASPAGLSAAELRRGVARARKLRDKYSTLVRKQKAAARARGAGRLSASNQNTKDKHTLFVQALARFEAALGRAGRSTRKAKPKAAAARPRAAKKKTATRRAAVASSVVRRAGATESNGRVSTIAAAGAVDVLGVAAARDLSRASYSKKATGQRLKNVFAGTANARIRGHARGAHRAAQARRDAQQRGE